MGEIRFTGERGEAAERSSPRPRGLRRPEAPELEISASGRPLLFLDVDGVLNVFASGFSAPQPDRREVSIAAGRDGEFQIPVSFDHELAERLRRLSGAFEVVWCTAWFEDANTLLREIAPEIGPWPVLQWRDLKITEILNRTPAGRPWVWIDDDGEWELTQAPVGTRERVGERGLVLVTDPSVGLSGDVLSEALRFARRKAAGS